MGRPERTIDPEAGPLQRFAHGLRQLRETAGRPSYRELSRRAAFSVTALSEAAGGRILPSLPVVLAYVRACGGDPAPWEARWRELLSALTPALDEGRERAPYLGLLTYDAADEQWFFGRRELVEAMRARVAECPVLALFAPSGAGKSSVLRAGLLPALSAAGDCLPVVLTPGEHPAQALARQLARLAPVPGNGARQESAVRRILNDRPAGTRLIIVVDQFEEIFTLCHEEDERAAFIAALTQMSGDPGVRIVVGVRADFYARCAAYPELVAALRDRQMLMGPMSAGELREVIVGPARQADLRVEPALVEVAVRDCVGEPGALPMLSHALRETWRRRTGTTLTLADYTAVGGVRGAIGRTAEQVYSRLEPEHQRLAREVFLRLTAFGEGTEDTRRRAAPAELLGGRDPQAMVVVLNELTTARLITTDEDSVTVAHEALITEWPRLRAWLAEDRELLRAHRRLTEAAAEWDQHDREDSYLYVGTRLGSWQDRPIERLNDVEAAFLAAGRQRATRERRQRLRRVRSGFAGLVAVATVVGVLAVVALAQARQATAERDLAASRQLIAEARGRLPLDPAGAVTLARRAYAIQPSTDAETALRQAVADFRVRGTASLNGAKAYSVAFSPDGSMLAATGAGGSVRIWSWDGRAVTGPAREPAGHTGDVWFAAFSPDGRSLATAGADATIRIWPTGRQGTPRTLRGHSGIVWAVAFSPDGTRLASAGADRTVRVWDLQRAGASPVVLRGHQGITSGVAFTPDGRGLASASHDRTVRVWDLATGRTRAVLRGPEDATKNLAFDRAGKRLYASSIDGAVWAWPAGGGPAGPTWRGHQGTVEGLALSPDDRWLATTSDDATVRVWPATGGGQPLVLRGHQHRVWSVAFSPGGDRLVSAGEDGRILVWDPRGPGDPVILRGHSGPVWRAVLSPDGRQAYSASADGTVRAWTLHAARRSRVLRGHRGEVLGLALSPDGRRLVSHSLDGTARLWDPAGSAEPVVLPGSPKGVWGAAFSPDGQRVATVGDRVLQLWSTGDPRAAERRDSGGTALSQVAFAPDGRRVAAGGKDGVIRIWDGTADSPPHLLRGHEGYVYSVTFAPDGRHLASAGIDGTVRVWPLTGAAAPTVLRGHQGFVWQVAYSRDGRWLASAGKDGTVRLWNAAAQTPAVTFSGFGASVESVDFGPDSTQLITSHDDGTVRVWRCDACATTDDLLARAEQLDRQPR